ncbi:MAG: hypothetical protein WBF03_05655 [Xanthobacteraceae bacterium]
MPVPLHPIGETHPARTHAPTEQRPDQRINTGKLDRQPSLSVGQPIAVEFGKPPLEIVAHQDDGQLGVAINDANAEFAEGGLQFLRPGAAERLNLHGNLLQVFRYIIRQQPQTGPVGRSGIARRGRPHDEPPIEQASDGILDLRSGKIRNKGTDHFAKALPSPDRGCEGAIERTVQKELSAFRIKAHDIGREDKNRKIRREAHAVAAALSHLFLAILRHSANACARDACSQPVPRIRVGRVLAVCARSRFLDTFTLSE